MTDTLSRGNCTVVGLRILLSPSGSRTKLIPSPWHPNQPGHPGHRGLAAWQSGNPERSARPGVTPGARLKGSEIMRAKNSLNLSAQPGLVQAMVLDHRFCPWHWLGILVPLSR